ncbi:MAG TPA: glycosyltransferase 87 family protein [Anaerolineae bacterium]|nr:glycosyltransferase 87 family protein [Anaerolineae bacterium]
MSQQANNPSEERRVKSSTSNGNGTAANRESVEAKSPRPDIDEEPRPDPVDEIHQALLEAAQANLRVDVAFDELAGPDLDDEVQRALKTAARQGQPTEVDFDSLPAPTLPEPQKVVTFETKPLMPMAAPPPTQPPEPPPQREAVSLPPPVAKPAPVVVEVRRPIAMVPDFWLLLTVFVSFRLLTLFLLRPGGFIRDWSDFDTYLGIASLSDYGLFPFLDFWLEWPPLVPWLSVGAYKLSLLLSPWADDARLWFILSLGTVFVLFEVGNFVLIHRLARRLFDNPATVTRVLWLYIGLFPPLYAMLGFFDGVALFFMLLALDLMLGDRRFLSAVAIGVGFMVKVIPILMLPVVLRRLWYFYRRDHREAGIEAGLYIVALAMTVFVLLLPFIVLPALNGSEQWWATSFRSILGRSSWETVWAVAEGYYGFGAVGGDRLSPQVSQAEFAIHEGWPDTVWLLITFAFGGLYYYLFKRQADYSQPRSLLAFAGLTLTIFLLYSKGYSPQFLVYLLPFVILLMPNGRGLTYALILTALNILEQPIYFVLLPEAHWLLVFVVVSRFLMLIVVGLEFGLMLWPTREETSRLATVHARAPVIVGALAGLALVVVTPLSVLAYNRHPLENTDLGTFVGFMETQAAGERLLLSEQETYRQIYPYLNSTIDLKLASFDPDLTERIVTSSRAAKPSDLLQGLEQVWVLPTGPHSQKLDNVVSNRGKVLASYNFGEVGLVSVYTFRPNPLPTIAPARFVGGVELLTHHVDVNSGSIEVTLYWRALDRQTDDRLTVFTQLLNAQGELVASHDSIPGSGQNPFTVWPIDEVQSDSHAIDLPSPLALGEYTLVVGIYNRFNERIPVINAQGISYPDRFVPLAKMVLPE